MASLDDRSLYKQLDPQDMGGHIERLPAQCARAWGEALPIKLPASYRKAEQVVVLGMGGSAIGGELVGNFTQLTSGPTVYVHRDYGTPSFINKRTLVIAASHSGNTEESLDAFKGALGKGAYGMAITSGGKLEKLCKGKGLPVFKFEYVGQPRAAIGYGVFPLLAVLQNLGLTKKLDAAVKEAVAEVTNVGKALHPNVSTAQNPAKQLAEKIGDKAVVIYGAQHLVGVARRWKGQIAENAKSWAFHEVIPELNHNTIEGYQQPSEGPRRHFVVLLNSNRYPPQIKRRIELTADLLEKLGIAHQVVQAQGKGALSQIMSTVLFGDYVSYYLAVLRGVDPTPVPTLGWMKENLAQR